MFLHMVFKVSATLIVITVLYTVLSIKVLFPEMEDKLLEIAIKKMEENKKLTEENLNNGINFTKNI